MAVKTKALGIVRRIDDLGRIVIPMEVRKANGWEPGQPMEMLLNEDGDLVVRAYGEDPAKVEVVEQLEDLRKNCTSDPEAYKVLSNAIEFLAVKRV